MNADESGAQEGRPMCVHLRCKGMYVPRSAGGPEEAYGGDTTNWWCLKTATSIGPDEDWVHRSACTPDRACFQRPGGLP
jgi:hypothetical protein